jgi:hypothetical protein
MAEALALIVAGLAAVITSEVLARRLARRYVIGRILAVAPQVSLEEAVAIARRGEQRYVRVHGRITSEEEFPDENDRPLVYRRKRIEVRPTGRRWQTIVKEAEGVPFSVESRDVAIDVDSTDLGEGLIVLPRESVGRVADLPVEIDTGGADPAAEARLVIEQISAVEHAFVAGSPRMAAGDRAVMTSGERRPLILTTLEIGAAMRVLAAGQRGRVIFLSGLLAGGVLLVVAGAVVGLATILATAGPALAQSPDVPIATPFDPRSEGEGPGLVGAPLLAALVVLAIGLTTAGLTYLYVRLSRERDRR